MQQFFWEPDIAKCCEGHHCEYRKTYWCKTINRKILNGKMEKVIFLLKGIQEDFEFEEIWDLSLKDWIVF